MSALTAVRRLVLPVALAVGLGAGAPATVAAQSTPPRPNDPNGAAVTITTPDVSPSGVVAFTGTGFNPAGQTVSVKVDDEQILHKSTPRGVFTAVASGADGSISGSVNLADANPATPIVPGTHWLRFLASGRTLYVNFTVTAPAAPAAPAPVPPPSTGPVDPGAPAPLGSPPAPVAPTAPTAPLARALPVGSPPLVTNGPVGLTESLLQISKSQLRLTLKAGALGSAGTVSVRSVKKYKIGKGSAKRQDVFKADAYFVDRVGTSVVKLRLTAAGKAIFKAKKRRKISAVVMIRDASEVTVKQPVVIKR